MGKEIERKFLVKDDSWRAQVKGKRYRQGYLNRNKERVVRVRTIDDKGFLTIKGKTKGATRAEFEYDIPVAEAEAMDSRWMSVFTSPDTLVLILVFGIPIVAILCGSTTAIVKMVIRHRERMRMIEQGIHPDLPPEEELDA